MNVRPARLRPADRVQTESQKQPDAQVTTYALPNGWVTNAALSAGVGASVFENLIRTRRGIEVRGGLVEACTVATAVKRMFQHRASGTYFAATATSIYPFTDASTGALTASVSGQTSGDYSAYEMQTSGGSFLVCVNGVDYMQQFNGTTWTQITGVSTPAITGVDTADLSHVWGHRSRLFFIEKGTLKAWYLGVESIAGAATALPLHGVFRRGGSLEFGTTWSSDAGDGIDDRCVFVTDAGEVAIYSGSDPGDPNNWALQGVYDIGETLGKAAYCAVGGDVLIGTRDGLVPLSAVVQKSPAELKAAAVSVDIAPDWQRATNLGQEPWRVARWDRGNMIFCNPMDSSTLFATQTETGSWTNITGWDCGDLQEFGDNLYVGGTNGSIYRAWVGGTDDGMPFVARLAFPFDHLGTPATEKQARAVQTVWRIKANILPKISVAKDYDVRFPSAPAASQVDDDSVGTWDVSDWDTAFWATDDEQYDIYRRWTAVAGYGFAFAPLVQLTSGSSGRIGAILERVDLVYGAGAAMT